MNDGTERKCETTCGRVGGTRELRPRCKLIEQRTSVTKQTRMQGLRYKKWTGTGMVKEGVDKKEIP